MTDYSASSAAAQQVFFAPRIGHNTPAFDFCEFFDVVVGTSLTAPEKLIQLVLARMAQKSGGTVAPRREDVIAQASCSEATFKRSFSLLKTFFEVEKRVGTTTQYSQKPIPTQDEITSALSSLRTKTKGHGDTTDGKTKGHHDTGIKSPEGHGDTKKVGITVIPGSKTTPVSDTTQKEKSPHTPLKENYIYNNHHHLEPSAGGGGQEVDGLNGATSLIVNKLAGWINSMMPDKRTAKGSLERLVALYGSEAVKAGFAELEGKMDHGDIIAKPIPYLTNAVIRHANKRQDSKVGKPDVDAMIAKHKQTYRGVL